MDRLVAVRIFYEILDELRDRLHGYRTLKACRASQDCAKQGVYFFFEPGENRAQSGQGLRVVRVGTHAVSRGSKTTLWNRLSAHRGALRTGGGNHRGSVFRLLVGSAILRRDSLYCLTWGEGKSAGRETRDKEHNIEVLVSEHIRRMPFLWLDVPGPASADCRRAYIERNAIGLLSNYCCTAEERIDPLSQNWLGLYCQRDKVCKSGLWNSRHTGEGFDPAFLSMLRDLVTHARRS